MRLKLKVGLNMAIDQRMQDIMNIISSLELRKGKECALDIGVGNGEITKLLIESGYSTTAIGLGIDTYDIELEKIKKQGVNLIECSVEKMPFDDNSFDFIVMSHILEHVLNIGVALAEVRRVLKENGKLLIIVPPYSDVIMAGHVSTGWNVGQLIYVMLLNGFAVNGGKFIEYGWNVCGLVGKNNELLPNLRYDRGDISKLNKAKLFPLPIENAGYNDDAFTGRIRAVNWYNIDALPLNINKNKEYYFGF